VSNKFSLSKVVDGFEIARFAPDLQVGEVNVGGKILKAGSTKDFISFDSLLPEITA
jgi:hypothetical protein